MRKFVGLGIALATSAAAFGDVSTSLKQAFPAGLPVGSQAWDLQVTVSGGDDWTSASMTATASGGAAILDPIPALTTYVPGFNDADTWWNGTGGSPGFAAGPTFSLPGGVSATWFETPPNGGDGTFSIARLVVNLGAEAGTVELKGAHTAKNSQGTLLPYSVVIPEPSTLGLLVLGGLATLIRRR